MTPPAQDPGFHNSFAIPRHRVPPGAGHPTVRWEEDWPLVPWSVHGHTQLYADVDDIENLIRHFREHGPQPDDLADTQVSSGHLVVVSGADGSGKTSLIHRCIDDLVSRLDAGSDDDTTYVPWGERRLPSEVKVVTVGGEQNVNQTIMYTDGDLAGIDEINRRIFRDIREKLSELDEEFRKRVELDGESDLRSTDLSVCYPALSRVLTDLGWFALIAVPNIRWHDELLSRRFLRSCSTHGQRRIVFFVESTNSRLEQTIEREFSDSERRHVTHLRIGGLRADDCAKFVGQRIRSAYVPVPRVTVAGDAVHGHAPELDYRCVRDLQNIFYRLAEKLRRNGEGVIDMARLRDFQEGNRRQLDSLAREPRSSRTQGPPR